MIWREGMPDDEESEHEVEVEVSGLDGAGFWKVASLGYGVVFAAEFGDLTQILTANLAAKYHDPHSAGIGAVLALWAAVGLLEVLAERPCSGLCP